MKTTIISFSKEGARLGIRIAKSLFEMDAQVFVKTSYPTEGAQRIEGNLSDFVGDRFRSDTALIFISSAGIATRLIAPFIKSKKKDPAVVVLDEAGQHVISLLSGHLGGANSLACRIAANLGAEPVVTTASDVHGKLCVEDVAELLGCGIDGMEGAKKVNASIVNDGKVGVLSDEDIPKVISKLYSSVDPTELNKIKGSFNALIVVSASTKWPHIDVPHVFLRPQKIVAGLGFKKDTSSGVIIRAIKKALEEVGISLLCLKSLATVDFKALEKGAREAAAELNVPLIPIARSRIKAVEKDFDSSSFVKETIGLGSVAEPSACLASHMGEKVLGKMALNGVTVALAKRASPKQGGLCLVGIGPGTPDIMTTQAKKSLHQADTIICYKGYLPLIEGMVQDKKVFTSGMMEELKRAKETIRLAMSGQKVALVSSGDPGVYAMASLVYELLAKDKEEIDVTVVPGVTSATAAAALLGAPLGNDFALISLSDHLTPWDQIERRLHAAGSSDFVIVLYNPRSSRRRWQLDKALSILRTYRRPETPVGAVKNGFREDEAVWISTLESLDVEDVDMMTTIVIGNSKTYVHGGWMITPRGYSDKYEL